MCCIDQFKFRWAVKNWRFYTQKPYKVDCSKYQRSVWVRYIYLLIMNWNIFFWVRSRLMLHDFRFILSSNWEIKAKSTTILREVFRWGIIIEYINHYRKVTNMGRVQNLWNLLQIYQSIMKHYCIQSLF